MCRTLKALVQSLACFLPWCTSCEQMAIFSVSVSISKLRFGCWWRIERNVEGGLSAWLCLALRPPLPLASQSKRLQEGTTFSSLHGTGNPSLCHRQSQLQILCSGISPHSCGRQGPCLLIPHSSSIIIVFIITSPAPLGASRGEA